MDKNNIILTFLLALFLGYSIQAVAQGSEPPPSPPPSGGSASLTAEQQLENIKTQQENLQSGDKASFKASEGTTGGSYTAPASDGGTVSVIPQGDTEYDPSTGWTGGPLIVRGVTYDNLENAKFDSNGRLVDAEETSNVRQQVSQKPELLICRLSWTAQ